MDVVYKARDTHLDRFAAIKVLHPERVSDPDRKRRFIQEAKAASALNHPNIVTIYDIDQEAGVEFIAMEYVAGKTLDELIPRKGMRFSLGLNYAVQIADALARAHGAGIIHRDLKPSNVMVDEHGLVETLDFGLAKLNEPEGAEAETAATRTGEGTVLGTAAYMSPEQAEGEHIDARSDIFSFGSVLYEMLTGQRAFRGERRASTIASILREEPKPISQVAEGLPREVDRIVRRCLRKDPVHRFQHMDDLKVTLEELKEESASATLTSGASPPVRGAALLRRRTLIAVGALGVTLLVGLAAVIWFFLRPASRIAGRVPEDGAARARHLRLVLSSESRVYDPALSPDGKMIAYVAEEQGREDLFVSRVAGGGRVRLTNDEAMEARPEFSPDGERVVFTRIGSDTGRPEIRIVPTLGGQAAPVLSDAVDPAWSADGSQLALILRRPGEGDVLAVCASDGTNLIPMLPSDGRYPFFRHPAWSPDGKQLVVVRSTGGIAGELWLVPLKGGAPHLLWEDPAGISSNEPVFTADGRGVVYQSNRAGATNLWTLPLGGGPPTRLTTGAGPDESPSLARTGLIAFLNARGRCGLIVCDLTSGRTHEIMSHSGYMWGPAFSPKGDELAINLGGRDGSWHIWVAPVRGGAARQLTAGSLPEVYARFTPDGAGLDRSKGALPMATTVCTPHR